MDNSSQCNQKKPVRQKATSSEAIKHSDNDSTQGAQIFNVTIERGTNINFGGKHTTI